MSAKKLFLLLFSLLLLIIQDGNPGVILWDIGNTLLAVDYSNAVGPSGGLRQFVGSLIFKLTHPCVDFQRHLYQKFIETLAAVPYQAKSNEIAYEEGGMLTPPLLIDRQTGNISLEQAQQLRDAWLAQNPKCLSSRERQIFVHMFDNIFNPERYVKMLYLLPAVSVLRECAQQKNADGSKKHICIICSNWDRDSFALLPKLFPQIFDYIDVAVISGHEHVLKPNHVIFERCLQIIKQKFPQQEGQPICFVEDLEKNRRAAEETFKRHGITIHCAHPDHCRAMFVANGILI